MSNSALAKEIDQLPGSKLHRNHALYTVPGLKRGLHVLEAVAAARRPLGISEIARAIGITRSAAFRLVYTLRNMGFLESDATAKTARLGARVLNIGFAYLASMDIIEMARPFLEELRDRTNVSSHLAIRDGKELLYLCCIQTRSGFLSTINVGARLPSYGTPMGWVLLADLPNVELKALFRREKFRPLTDFTPKNVAELMRHTANAATSGFVVSRGIMEPGGSSIATPIFDHSGRAVAAIDIAGPDSAFDLKQLGSRYLREVLATARRISARLGHSPAQRTSRSRA
ncbi:MAG TPA: IclR family transcriptional regulator [Stellaceae bacterium]|nr:IclR family transcriptional regulator [Stellaceae bacterium]